MRDTRQDANLVRTPALTTVKFLQVERAADVAAMSQLLLTLCLIEVGGKVDTNPRRPETSIISAT